VREGCREPDPVKEGWLVIIRGDGFGLAFGIGGGGISCVDLSFGSLREVEGFEEGSAHEGGGGSLPGVGECGIDSAFVSDIVLLILLQ
jgi:hypothetical protein